MSIWTEADKDALRTMWALGVPSGGIAAALGKGVTRSATMGMVNRLGLMGLGHADAGRLKAIRKVEEVMDAAFSLGEPLHREALLAFRVGHSGRDADRLALCTGVARPACSAFLARLPLVWPSGPMPSRWRGSLEGVLAFVLDMAVVAGRLEASPVRGPIPSNSDDGVPDSIAA